MKTRICTALVAMGVLAGVLLLYDTFWFHLACIAVVLLAIYELLTAYKLSHHFLLLATLALPVAAVLLRPYLTAYQLLWPLLFYMVLWLAMVMVFGFHRYQFTELAPVVLFSAVVLLGFYCVVEIKTMFSTSSMPSAGVFHTLLALAAAWGGDTAAYFAGSFFGKHKLAPTLSPKKTVEGAVGGVVGSVVCNTLFLFMYSQAYALSVPAAKYGVLCVVAGVASLLGMLGDLFASAVKRQCGIKDYGYIFPGHGGVLDRFDSVLLTLPFYTMVYQYITLL